MTKIRKLKKMPMPNESKAEILYQKLDIFLQNKAGKIVCLFIIAYISLFCLISFLKYKTFAYNDIDLSVIDRIFWNTIHGNLVTDSVGEATIFNGGHLFLTIFLLAPVYAVYPHPLTLLFMQSIALACPAYFVFRFVRDKIDTTFATYFALAYLLYPALAFVNLFELHIIAFAPLFLIPMFLFFDQRRFWPFILFMFLSLACKEDVSLIIFGLGIYATFRYVHIRPPFIKNKDWKWIVVPLLSGALWFVIVTQIIQPHFTLSELKDPSGSQAAFGFYAWLGGTPKEIIRNILFHPGQVLKGVFIPAKNTYLLHLFGPLAFLSVFGLKEIIIVLFGLLESLLSQRSTHFSIHYQYAALIIPFIFISAIFGLKRLLQFKFFKPLKLYVLIILFAVSLFSAFNIGPILKLPFDQWRRDGRDALKEKFVDLIPHNAAVATTFELATRLTHRDRLFFIYQVNMADWNRRYAYLAQSYGKKADYLLIDFLDNLAYFGFYYQNSDMCLRDFLKKYNWNVDYEINNITLWTKEQANAKKIIETIETFPVQLSGPTFSSPEIKLVGSFITEQEILGFLVLHFDGYLECRRRTEKRYILQLDFYDKQDKALLYRHYFMAPDKIYPTKRWKRGEKIKITQNVLLPDNVEVDECDLVLKFCLVPEKK